MKIHLVTANENGLAPQQFLVKAHTKAGAEKYVREKFKPKVEARVATQDDLVDALKAGTPIEDATSKGATSAPNQTTGDAAGEQE